MRRVSILFATLLFSIPAMAQEAASQPSFWSDPLKDPMFPFYMVTVFVFLTALLVVIVSVYMLQVLNVFIRKQEEAKAEQAGIKYQAKQGWWTRMWMELNAFKPAEKEADILLDHNYDGIRELDNHLPPWWKWLLYATIAWGIIYMIVYHVTDSFPLQDDEYVVEVTKAEEQRARFIAANPPEAIDETTLVYTPDEEIIQSGRKVYVTNCASCHMPEGQGSIGPNLTDEYWLHGGSVKDIYAIIKNGVQEKGMIPWGPVLSPDKIRDVTFYIMSLKGTNPPNPKAPQGELYKDETIKKDTVNTSP